MAIEIRQQVPVTVRPVALPRRARLADVTAWLVVSILLGVAAGTVVHSLVAAQEDAVYAAQIQAMRAAGMVEAYEGAWASLQPVEPQIRIAGTGPGLAWAAEQQTRWAEHAITGTGPGLVTVAELQAGFRSGSEPTGTGPGLEHLPETLGEEVALVGTP